MAKLFVILDANSIMHRSYHALPPLTTRAGELVNAVYGFASILFTILSQEKPFYIAAAFDTAAPTFRHEVYKEYKAGRIKPPQEFYDQIPRIEEIVRTMNIPILKKDGFEADDIIGTVVKRNEREHPELQNKIVTSDFDAMQLVSDKTCVATLHKGYKANECFFKNEVLQKYGLYPEQIVDFKALQGDASDNIPGVKGIGKIGALSLLATFGSVENLYQHLDQVKGAKKKILEEGKENAFFSRKLATIKTDVEFDYDLDACKAHDFDSEKVNALFESLQFYSLIRRLKEWQKTNGLSSQDLNEIFPQASKRFSPPSKDQNVLFE